MANEEYVKEETRIEWLASGGDYTLTADVASGAGRQGAAGDFSSFPRAGRHRFMLVIDADTTPVVGELVRLFWKEGNSDGAADVYTNDDGAGDAAVSAEDKLKNLQHLGTLEIDEAAAAVNMVIVGEVFVRSQKGMPVIWNGTADDIDVFFYMWPIPHQGQ